jgi:hypothetical protein
MTTQPNAVERQVLTVNDIFFTLLDRRDPRAAQMAGELFAIAERYQPQSRPLSPAQADLASCADVVPVAADRAAGAT